MGRGKQGGFFKGWNSTAVPTFGFFGLGLGLEPRAPAPKGEKQPELEVGINEFQIAAVLIPLCVGWLEQQWGHETGGHLGLLQIKVNQENRPKYLSLWFII